MTLTTTPQQEPPPTTDARANWAREYLHQLAVIRKDYATNHGTTNWAARVDALRRAPRRYDQLLPEVERLGWLAVATLDATMRFGQEVLSLLESHEHVYAPRIVHRLEPPPADIPDPLAQYASAPQHYRHNSR